MMKLPLRIAIILGVTVMPLHAVFAVPTIPADEIAATIKPLTRQYQWLFVKASAKGKTYTVKKQFTLVMPTTWKKLTTAAGYTFSAQPVGDDTTGFLITTVKYSTQKKATTANNNLRKTPNVYGDLVLKQLRLAYPDQVCTIRNVGKKTLGTNNGARVNVICGPEDSQITFSVFSFIHGLTFYGVMYVIPTPQFSKLMPTLDAITASIKFL